MELSAPSPESGGNPMERRYRLVRKYELVFIISPQVESEGASTVVETVKNLVARVGGEVVQVESWGTRRLAYPIKKQWEGQYVLMRLNLAPASVAELERSIKLIEGMLRYQIVLDEGAGATEQATE